jgi:hypothetical protein
MSSELFDYIKEKYSKSGEKSATLEQMSRQRVKNTISNLCKKYLQEAGQVFTFEVTRKDLPYAIIAIDEEPLKSMYNIQQISETIFQVSLKELEL